MSERPTAPSAPPSLAAISSTTSQSVSGIPTSPAPGAQLVAKSRARRPYVHELDPIRVITALSVVAVHVMAFSAVLNSTSAGGDIQIGVSGALHFTREVFMFTTAFVLVYSYAGTNFNLRVFARKRGITVLIPYVLWSLIYIWFNRPGLSPKQFSLAAVKAVLTGDASYQLYYILLTIQFYLLFPLLLLLLPWMLKRKWLVLGVSCAVELALLSFDFVFLENLHATPVFASVWVTRIDYYQDRFVLVYQFYFILGAIAALNVERVRAFLVGHGRMIAAAMVATLGALYLNFVFAVWVGHNTADYATAVLQPEMVPYSLVVLAFLGWLACRWAARRGADGKPRAVAFWRTLADGSFGIYLVHPLILTAAMKFVAPALPAALPVALRVALLFVLVGGLSAGVSVALLKTPVLSGTVGRPSSLPALDRLRDRLRAKVSTRLSGWKRSGVTQTVQPSTQTIFPERARITADLRGDLLASARADVDAQDVDERNVRDLSDTHDLRGLRSDVRIDAIAADSGDSLAASAPGTPERAASSRGIRDERRAIHRAERRAQARTLKRRGWRHKEIAAELGVSRSTVSYWLRSESAENS